MRRTWPLLALLSAFGCRPEPGPSPYDNQETFPHPDGGSDGDTGSLPGPNPFQPGTKRLSVGAFYEGGHSDEIPIDNVMTHVYVYEDTVNLQVDTDRVEGKISNKVVLTGKPWWGFGVHWDSVHDLHTWKTMHVSFQSSDATYADFTIGMNHLNNQTPFFVKASQYGFATDGSWHTLAIPIADFVAQGLDLPNVNAAFVLSGLMGPGGAALKVDDLYFTAD